MDLRASYSVTTTKQTYIPVDLSVLHSTFSSVTEAAVLIRDGDAKSIAALLLLLLVVVVTMKLDDD